MNTAAGAAAEEPLQEQSLVKRGRTTENSWVLSQGSEMTASRGKAGRTIIVF